MTPPLLYGLAGAGLICLGLHALILHRHLLRKILALNVIGGGGFLLLAGLAGRTAEGGPDPVPQAMVLTGIVVAVAATALALALLLRLHAATGAPLLPDEDNP